MSDYDYLPVSNGSGDAALMHITASRIIGGTTITVDSTTNVPTKFIGTYGTLLATNLLDPTTKRDFKGHVIDATHIGIDAFEPGSSDSANLATGQVIVVKPNTGWANRIAGFIKNATGFGTPENVTFAQITGSALVSALHDHTNSAGGGQLGSGALATSAVTPYKLAAAILEGSGGSTHTPTTSITDVTGSSVTFSLASPCFLLVTYGATMQSNGNITSELRLNVDGTDVATGSDAVENSNNSAVILINTDARTFRVTLAAGSHTIKLRSIATNNAASVITSPYWWGILLSQ